MTKNPAQLLWQGESRLLQAEVLRTKSSKNKRSEIEAKKDRKIERSNKRNQQFNLALQQEMKDRGIDPGSVAYCERCNSFVSNVTLHEASHKQSDRKHAIERRHRQENFNKYRSLYDNCKKDDSDDSDFSDASDSSDDSSHKSSMAVKQMEFSDNEQDDHMEVDEEQPNSLSSSLSCKKSNINQFLLLQSDESDAAEDADAEDVEEDEGSAEDEGGSGGGGGGMQIVSSSSASAGVVGSIGSAVEGADADVSEGGLTHLPVVTKILQESVSALVYRSGNYVVKISLTPNQVDLSPLNNSPLLFGLRFSSEIGGPGQITYISVSITPSGDKPNGTQLCTDAELAVHLAFIEKAGKAGFVNLDIKKDNFVAKPLKSEWSPNININDITNWTTREEDVLVHCQTFKWPKDNTKSLYRLGKSLIMVPEPQLTTASSFTLYWIDLESWTKPGSQSCISFESNLLGQKKVIQRRDRFVVTTENNKQSTNIVTTTGVILDTLATVVAHGGFAYRNSLNALLYAMNNNTTFPCELLSCMSKCMTIMMVCNGQLPYSIHKRGSSINKTVAARYYKRGSSCTKTTDNNLYDKFKKVLDEMTTLLRDILDSSEESSSSSDEDTSSDDELKLQSRLKGGGGGGRKRPTRRKTFMFDFQKQTTGQQCLWFALNNMHRVFQKIHKLTNKNVWTIQAIRKAMTAIANELNTDDETERRLKERKDGGWGADEAIVLYK